jgi:hypothetical protein
LANIQETQIRYSSLIVAGLISWLRQRCLETFSNKNGLKDERRFQ